MSDPGAPMTPDEYRAWHEEAKHYHHIVVVGSSEPKGDVHLTTWVLVIIAAALGFIAGWGLVP